MSDEAEVERDAFSGCRRVVADDGTIFHVLEPDSFPRDRLGILGDLAEPVLPPGATLLKEARQRFVARVPRAEGGASLVYKVFPLKNPLSRLRYRKYALKEFSNMRRALARGIPVPAPVAYFEKRRFGLVTSTGVVMEDLEGWETLREMAYGRQGDLRSAAMKAVGPLVRLFETGCHHVDGRDENILFAGGDYRVIDWQYAVFTEPRAPLLMEYLCAYFIYMLGSSVDETLRTRWLAEVGAAAGIGDRERFGDRVRRLASRKRSLRERMNRTPLD